MTAILGGLFLTAFLSATLLPGSSEVFLVSVISAGKTPIAIAVLIATAGNTLGSSVNWGVGRFLAQFRTSRWFPVSPQKYEQYTKWYQRWGIWSLLLSWMPVIGDPITVVAGIARSPFLLFVFVVFLAKGARYLVVAGVVNAVF